MTVTVAAKVQAIFTAREMRSREAGPFLAASGVPVFPCVPSGKTPLVSHGLLDATVDSRIAERWWRRWPQANIGMPTGPVSGFDVVDVDVRDTGSGHRAFRRAGMSVDTQGWVLRIFTPSGGAHFYYPTHPDQTQRSWVSGKAHVDFRGAGGYVILPPSVGDRGDGTPRPYFVAATQAFDRPIAAERLREVLDPAWAKRRADRPVGMSGGDARESALKDWVASRPEGERNAGLFWAACRMVEAGHDLDTTLTVLADSAVRCGLQDREITATVRSAYRHTRFESAGTCQPVSRPVGVDRQQVMIL